MILKPGWVTEKIAAILKDKRVAARGGALTRSAKDQIWSDLEPSMRNHFLRLMEKFDLSCPIPDHEDAVCLIVEHLSRSEPQFQDRWNQLAAAPEIRLRYRFESTIPAGLPTWFIAREHRFTTGIQWRYGALLQDGDHLGLIQCRPHARELDLAVRGPWPAGFFSVLRDGFELTLKRFPGLTYRALVNCPGHGGVACEHLFDYEDLARGLRKPGVQIQCPKGFAMFTIPELLIGITQSVTALSIEGHLGLEQRAYLRRVLGRIADSADRIERMAVEDSCPQFFVLYDPSGIQTIRGVGGGDGRTFHLVLYCGAKDKEHPVNGQAPYEITNPPEFVKLMPHLTWLLKNFLPFLKVLPDAFAQLGTADQKALGKAMTGALEQLGRIAEKKSIPIPSTRPSPEYFEEAEGARLRVLRQLLYQLDPLRHWHGLQPVRMIEGDYRWLCQEHAGEVLASRAAASID